MSQGPTANLTGRIPVAAPIAMLLAGCTPPAVAFSDLLASGGEGWVGPPMACQVLADPGAQLVLTDPLTWGDILYVGTMVGVLAACFLFFIVLGLVGMVVALKGREPVMIGLTTGLLILALVFPYLGYRHSGPNLVSLLTGHETTFDLEQGVLTTAHEGPWAADIQVYDLNTLTVSVRYQERVVESEDVGEIDLSVFPVEILDADGNVVHVVANWWMGGPAEDAARALATFIDRPLEVH